MSKKNLVVIGYGGMGGWHVQHALDSDVVTLLGVYDIDPARNALAESRGIHAYATYDEVLADDRVDMITVAIPNDSHEAVCIRAMEAGKHVICEKPVTLSCESLQRMCEASRRTGRVFSVHQNRRWDVDYLAMQQLADSGEIGEVIRIESRIHGSRGIPSDWRGIKKYGGGMLYDWGIHLIDQVMLVIPEPVVQVGCAFDHITNKEVDDGFRLELTFASGKTAYVEVGTYNFIAMPRFYMRAQKGTALITDWREPCQVVKCKYWHESEVLPVETAAGLTKTMAPRDEVTTDTYRLERPTSDVHTYYRNFTAAMDGTATQLVTHPQMMRVLQVIEAAFDAAENNRIVTCHI
ncbi:MAG: Gfo/Idh/MocA family oxidoreductase [Ruminococcaceae bacterium]|nr:Gfo/Idh/MocA family oxidoreductase [Oscillospiraceae bacterium]